MRSMALFLILVAPNDQIDLDDVAMRGWIEPSAHAVVATIGTAVRLPVGRIRVTGHARVQYRCDGTFDGTVHYAWPVRVAARIKGVELATQLAGEAHVGDGSECQVAANAFAGRFAIRDTVLAGYLRMGNDSIALEGEARRLTPVSWSAVATSPGRAGLTIRVHFVAREEHR